MNDNDIYRISHLINEDPDLIDDESGMLIDYTNSMGETKQYRITRAWPLFYRRSGLIGYNVEWPNGTFGFLKLDGLSEESYELLKSKYEDERRASYEYRTIKGQRKKLKKTQRAAKPGTERRSRWNYMF